MIAHWDEVEGRLLETGPMRLTRVDLGDAIGSDRIGVALLKIQPGGRSSPVHAELAEEEIFYVLRGSGILWQDDGSGPATCEVREGDTIVHVAAMEYHTLVAGDDGLDVLAFGQRVWATATSLPRAGVLRMDETVDQSTGPHPWEREAAAGELELPELGPRPKNVVALADAPVIIDGAVRILGATGGSVRTGLNTFTQTADGQPPYVPHCHAAEEEIFVLLEGSATLHLGDETHEVRAGHAISRRPGTGVPHWFVPGPEGMTQLAYGTREPNDIVYYPESGEVLLCGVGVRLQARQG
ncbi:MAG TPA: cupin domain-containing protein [Gaiellaceae bacterium]|nr:cupin domain-containing protein [Gaiellaceae bacterium]